MKYRYQAVKMAVILICVLAAGVCYSCDGMQDGWESGELPVMNAPGDAGTSQAEDATGDSDPYGNAKESEETEIPVSEETAVSVCYVHICGEVVLPGVYEMEEGSRIFQVVERAGGFTERAAAQYLNMAQVVSDGMKIVVPDGESLDGAERYGIDSEGGNHGAGSAGAGVIMPEGKTAGGSTANEKVKVNLNTATREELMTLKGIGEAKADDIIAYRESHGGFQKIEDIKKISGIKDAAFEKIKDDITV
ncbi:competence protein ComEA [Hungatella effluvii]|uniref:Competence protein ComEA n=1 Tax=Hungatella effluvii TaxID=1096246 RepID=A0A2V3YD23_9FIRM|nr:helix-hairpin-helix domain-containing protein [Hungatella effluvii]PXX57301.1 competence protein ComEA [Hungatella effluvii]